jgi:hypothetical protein
MKKENNYNNETCQTGTRQKSKIFGRSKFENFERCGCSANYIWLGIAVILFIMAIAMIFGN